MPPMAGIVLRWLQLASGALGGRTGDIFGIPRSACVQAIASGAEMRDLQESTSDHDVLEKMDHLISVSEVVVKEDRRCQREHRKARRHLSNTKTKDQQQPAANFEGNGNCPAQRRQGQAHAADVGCRRSEGSELAEAAHEERQTDEYATKQWQKSCSFHVRLSSTLASMFGGSRKGDGLTTIPCVFNYPLQS